MYVLCVENVNSSGLSGKSVYVRWRIIRRYEMRLYTLVPGLRPSGERAIEGRVGKVGVREWGFGGELPRNAHTHTLTHRRRRT